MTPLLIDVLYLFSTALIVAGIWSFFRPAGAGRGSLFAGSGLALATLSTLAADDVRFAVTALVGLALGAGLGALAGIRSTRETAMGRLALLIFFVSFGAALIGPIRLHEVGAAVDTRLKLSDEKWKGVPDDVRRANEVVQEIRVPLRSSMPAVLATMLGGVAAGASLISYLKLTRSPIRKSLPKLEEPRMPQIGTLVVCVLLGMLLTAWPLTETFLWLELLAGLLLGYLLTIHLKIVDVPPVLAASGALMGTAMAAAGIMIGNIMMVAAGGIVTAGGAAISLALCESLNVSLAAVVLGTQTSKISSREDADRNAPREAPAPASRTVTPDPDAPIL